MAMMVLDGVAGGLVAGLGVPCLLAAGIRVRRLIRPLAG
jgi:hypothetical protein